MVVPAAALDNLHQLLMSNCKG